jgi:hypothetical protein
MMRQQIDYRAREDAIAAAVNALCDEHGFPNRFHYGEIHQKTCELGQPVRKEHVRVACINNHITHHDSLVSRGRSARYERGWLAVDSRAELWGAK